MCFDPTAEPPIPAADPPAELTTHALRRNGRALIHAVSAQASIPSGAAAVVLPDGRGLHPYYERLVQRLAEHGSDAIAIDYYERDAAGEKIGPARWDDVLENIGEAIALLRDGDVDRPVVTIGFCVGGRLAYLTASESTLGLSAVVGLYGQPFGPTKHDLPAPLDRVDEVCTPITAIFGGADELVPVADAATYGDALVCAGVEHEVVVYDGAPHSFFDRSGDLYADECADVWRRLTTVLRTSKAVA